MASAGSIEYTIKVNAKEATAELSSYSKSIDTANTKTQSLSKNSSSISSGFKKSNKDLEDFGLNSSKILKGLAGSIGITTLAVKGIGFAVGEMSKSLQPQIDKLKSSFGSIFQDLGTGLAPAMDTIVGLVEEIVALVQPFIPIITQTVSLIVSVLKPAIDAILVVVRTISDLFLKIANFITLGAVKTREQTDADNKRTKELEKQKKLLEDQNKIADTKAEKALSSSSDYTARAVGSITADKLTNLGAGLGSFFSNLSQEQANTLKDYTNVVRSIREMKSSISKDTSEGMNQELGKRIADLQTYADKLFSTLGSDFDFSQSALDVYLRGVEYVSETFDAITEKSGHIGSDLDMAAEELKSVWDGLKDSLINLSGSIFTDLLGSLDTLIDADLQYREDKQAILESNLSAEEKELELQQLEADQAKKSSQVWKDFGKKVMESLQSIMQELAGNLLILAVRFAITGNWVGAGIAAGLAMTAGAASLGFGALGSLLGGGNGDKKKELNDRANEQEFERRKQNILDTESSQSARDRALDELDTQYEKVKNGSSWSNFSQYQATEYIPNLLPSWTNTTPANVVIENNIQPVLSADGRVLAETVERERSIVSTFVGS